MKILKLRHVCIALLLAGLASCGTSADKGTTETIVEHNSVANDTLVAINEDTNLINTAYEKFVFAIDSQNEQPETYFTANALKKLQEDYEYDCGEEPCYAFYALRTKMQDSNPETDGASMVNNIKPDGNDWYVVSYSDMGWTGKTRIKIAGGKIDDYQRIEQ